MAQEDSNNSDKAIWNSPTDSNLSIESNSDRDGEVSKASMESPSTFREVVGSSLSKISDAVNENIIAARYATIASIGLLAAYGISHTPLFFRYRTVAEIPASYFRGRKCITGRLIRVIHGEKPDLPIVCFVRHLSPAERILSTSLYERLMKLHPATAFGNRPDQSPHELLQIEIAGVRTPPSYFSYTEQPGEWLQRLAREYTIVTCQFLARRVPASHPSQQTDIVRSKRAIPEYDSHMTETVGQSQTALEDSAAVCKLFYRPKTLQLFSTDVADSLIRFGRASLASDGLYAHVANNRLIDATSSVKDLQHDASYMEQLSKLEYEAARGKYGMWADVKVRDTRKDVVEEVEFQASATIWQKLWRWVREG